MDWDLVPERTALTNVDLQNCFVDSLDDPQPLLDRVNQLAASCRASGILVIRQRRPRCPDPRCESSGDLDLVAAEAPTGVAPNEALRVAGVHQLAVSLWPPPG